MIDWESLRAIVLDIEGTTCPVDFVTGSLFPYARQHLSSLLSQADQQAPLKPLLPFRAGGTRNTERPGNGRSGQPWLPNALRVFDVRGSSHYKHAHVRLQRPARFVADEQ